MTTAQRLADALDGQGVKLPNGDWWRLDQQNRQWIAERLLSLPGIAIVDPLPTPHGLLAELNRRGMSARIIGGNGGRYSTADVSEGEYVLISTAALAAAVRAQENAAATSSRTDQSAAMPNHEQWTDVPGYAGYQITPTGRVRSTDRRVPMCGAPGGRLHHGKELKPVTRLSRPQVRLHTDDGTPILEYIDDLLRIAFDHA